MPRRNKRGRSPRSHPKRYYRVRTWDADASEPENAGPPAEPTLASPQTKTCSDCREWLPPSDQLLQDRGHCLHPGSGVVAPPATMAACAFFQGKRRA